MTISKKNLILTISLAVLAAFWYGCSLAGGLAGVASSETESEKITKAEFKLKQTEGKILVLVHQSGWIKSPMDLRSELTKYINESLVNKENVKLDKERIIEYNDVLKARLQLSEDKRDEPNQIAAKLQARYIIYVQILDFDLQTFAERNIYNGLMSANFCLLDESGKKLWPQGDNNKTSLVEIEAEKGTMEKSVAKLAAATAHCITRYFYDCRTIRFRPPEEHRDAESYDF
mgnify:CR=1 FL=1